MNKPITPEQMTEWVEKTWRECQERAWSNTHTIDSGIIWLYNNGMVKKGTKMTKTPVYANLDHALLIADLAFICARLPRQDNVLAGMLIKWFDNRGTLSAKQQALAQAILTRNQELLNA